MTNRKAYNIVREIGMVVKDGLGFTVCGIQLIDGDWIASMNGWTCHEIAKKVIEREEKGHSANSTR